MAEDLEKCVANTMSLDVVQGRVRAQLLNSSSFAAGLSCRTATVVTVSPDAVNWDPAEAELGSLLGAVTVSLVVLLLVASGILKICSRTRTKMEEAERSGNWQRKARLTARLMTLDTILTWGVAFAAAAQLNLVLDAIIPDDPSYWRVVSFCTLVVAVCVLAASMVAGLGPRRPTEAQHSLAIQVVTTLVSGSVYVCALAFLSMTTALFRMDGYDTADDLGPLVTFAAVVCVLAAVIITVYAVGDHDDALKTSELLVCGGEKEAAEEGGSCWSRCCGWMLINRRLVRSLVPRIASMSAVCAVYSVLYLSLAKQIDKEATLTSALDARDAIILCLVCLVLSVTIVVIVKWILDDAALRLTASARAVVPGMLSGESLALIQTLLQTTAAAMVEAAAWVLGCGLYALGLALWSDWVSETAPDEGALAAWAFAILFVLLALCTLSCVPAPPKAAT